MSENQFLKFGIVALLGMSPMLTQAQTAAEAPSAFVGLQAVSQRFGPQIPERIVQMEGDLGRSQPRQWHLIVLDAASPYLLHSFSVEDGKPTDEGFTEEYYPNDVPRGFIDRAKLQIDSTAAFRILDAEARKAGIGFDSIHYRLRCRDYSDEPVWELTALGVDQHPMGRIDASGATGEILRTVWYQWSPNFRGAPKVVDSMMPAGVAAGLASVTPDPGASTLPPTVPPVPAPAPGGGLTPAPGKPTGNIWERADQMPRAAPRVEVGPVTPGTTNPADSAIRSGGPVVPSTDPAMPPKAIRPGTPGAPVVEVEPAGPPGASVPPVIPAPPVAMRPGVPATPGTNPQLPPALPGDVLKSVAPTGAPAPLPDKQGITVVNDPESDTIEVLPLASEPLAPTAPVPPGTPVPPAPNPQ